MFALLFCPGRAGTRKGTPYKRGDEQGSTSRLEQQPWEGVLDHKDPPCEVLSRTEHCPPVLSWGSVPSQTESQNGLGSEGL